MSRLALRSSLGVSSRSVADWNRSWNRCFSMSRRVRLSWSSLIPRYSAAFAAFMFPPLNVNGYSGRLSLHEAVLERHLLRHAGQAVLGRGLGQAADLGQGHARR